MTVYADILVIVNLYIDYILLCCVRRFLRLQTTGIRLVLGALAGAFCSLSGLLPLPGFAGPILGGICALAAAGAAFSPAKPRLFFRCWLCMWLFSFLLAGFLLFVTQFAPPGYFALVGGSVYLNLSLPLLFFATCLAYFLFWALGRFFLRDSSPPLSKFQIEHQGKTVSFFAKADTGNALREPFSGLPVVVCQKKILGDLSPPSLWELSACNPLPSGLRLVLFESLGGRGLLPAFKPDRIIQCPTGRELECYLAVTDTPLSAGEFSALYNPELFPDENLS